MDSDTVSLRDAFAAEFPSTSTRPGLKVHKFFSLGRNNIVDFKISAARDHDAPFLRVDESWRGRGLIVGLGYTNLKLLRDCQEHGVMLIIRLKSGWKPLLLGVADADGRVVPSHDEWVMEGLVDLGPDELDGQTIDMDVRCGRGSHSVDVRLVGVPGPETCYWCLTTLPRDTHPPSKVCTLYRCRWEVELDMKRDKSGGRLDQIRATTRPSLMTLVYASLLRTVIANHIVYLDLSSRPKNRPPLHGLAVALALGAVSTSLLLALIYDDPRRWEKAAESIRRRAEDPNWRHRPSVVDTIRGTTAPRGRPKRKRLSECSDEARPYRRRAG